VTGRRGGHAPAAQIAANAPIWEVQNDYEEEAALCWICNNCSRMTPRRSRRTKARMALDTLRAARAAAAQETA
jgi:hypothetical protein